MALGSEMTPADIAAVTGNNNNGWGNDSASWIIILFLFIKAIESMGYKHAGLDIHTVLDGAQKDVKRAGSMSVEDVRKMLDECIGKLGG